jgi:hypothetical protein
MKLGSLAQWAAAKLGLPFGCHRRPVKAPPAERPEPEPESEPEPQRGGRWGVVLPNGVTFAAHASGRTKSEARADAKRSLGYKSRLPAGTVLARAA